jgi:hypothetical protein
MQSLNRVFTLLALIVGVVVLIFALINLIPTWLIVGLAIAVILHTIGTFTGQ